MKIVKIQSSLDLERLLKRLKRQDRPSAQDEATVARVLAAIKKRGDSALLEYVRRFDGAKLRSARELRVPASDIRAAYTKVDKRFIKALESARANIQAYQIAIKPASWRRTLRPGVMLGQSVRPIARVGVYVPGGAAPLVSTVLMTVVPAKVAGVREIALATPNRGQGLDPRLLVAADLAGATEIYQMGGAQAIAALAFGTASIKAVDKICGPGSKWVNLAKQKVYGEVGIDSLAGPSEAMLLCDDSAQPRLVAADLLSQAEHAGDETAVLVTTSERLAKAAQKELAIQLKALPRRALAARSLARHGLMVVVKNLYVALDIVAVRAPEHLQLMVRGAEAYIPKVKAAGAIFVGTYTPVALGDFMAGPSHVLPTGTTARFMSGLSVEDYLVKSSLIGYSKAALQAASEDLAQIARAEGLDAHERSVSLRVGKS